MSFYDKRTFILNAVKYLRQASHYSVRGLCPLEIEKIVTELSVKMRNPITHLISTFFFIPYNKFFQSSILLESPIFALLSSSLLWDSFISFMEKIETVRRKLAQLPLPNPLTSFIFLPLLYPHIIMEEIPPSNPRLILLTTLDPNSSSLLGRLSLLIIPSVFSFSGISNHSFSTSSFPLWIKCSQTSPIVKKKKSLNPTFPSC